MNCRFWVWRASDMTPNGNNLILSPARRFPDGSVAVFSDLLITSLANCFVQGLSRLLTLLKAPRFPFVWPLLHLQLLVRTKLQAVSTGCPLAGQFQIESVCLRGAWVGTCLGVWVRTQGVSYIRDTQNEESTFEHQLLRWCNTSVFKLHIVTCAKPLPVFVSLLWGLACYSGVFLYIRRVDSVIWISEMAKVCSGTLCTFTRSSLSICSRNCGSKVRCYGRCTITVVIHICAADTLQYRLVLLCQDFCCCVSKKHQGKQ